MQSPSSAINLPTTPPEPDAPRLLISVVNYKTADLVINCLRSLIPELARLPKTQVVVVDNNSGDGSADTIAQAIAQEGWGDWATLVASPINGGFSYGNNLAMRPAFESANPPAYYMLLNPDTEVLPHALVNLLAFMDAHPEAGIAGSCIVKGNGELKPLAFRFPSILGELNNGLQLGIVSKLLAKWEVAQDMPTDRPQPVGWLPGACMVIRREVLADIGLMDDNYFLYYEETDFCLQATRAGWSCWFVPESKVMHLAGQSTGVTGDHQAPKRLPQYVFDSRRRYFLKNHGFFYAALADLAFLGGLGLRRIRLVLQRKPYGDRPYLWTDSLRNSVLLKGGRGL